MSHDPYRTSAPDLPRAERWDRDRFYYGRDRDQFSDSHSHFEEDDHVYSRTGPPPRGPVRRQEPPRRAFDDDIGRERRVYYDDDPRLARRSPPGSDFDRRVTVDRERTYARSPSPPRRPGMLLRRQSSLDTFDRRPRGYPEREEYGPPARRDDYRAPPYVPIPLPRSKGLPPPRYGGREYHEEIRVSDPDHFGDDDFRPPYPERVREKEIIRTRRRDRSRESRATRSHARSSSRSSSVSSSSASSGGGTSVKSEYPKKGKTRIPARLVSKRALLDLNYPYLEEGHTIVVQKALGQVNIDDLLKLSEEYKKSDLELSSARSHTEEFVEERRQEVFVSPPAVVVPADPPQLEVVDTTVIRRRSPSRSSRRSHSTSATSHIPVVVDARPREVSNEIAVGPLALVEASHHHHHHSHHRGGSTSERSIRSEIRDLERELARRERYGGGGELVRAERLPTGELVLYEEEVEKVELPSRGVRIEKDKKGPPPQLMKAMLATLT